MRQRSKWLVELIANKNVRSEYIEYILAQLNLRLIEELELRQLSLREAESMLFNIDVYSAIEKRKLSRECREILEWGMELEDVKDLELDFRPSFDTMRKMSKKILLRISPKERMKGLARRTKKTFVAA